MRGVKWINKLVILIYVQSYDPKMSEIENKMERTTEKYDVGKVSL